MKKNLLNKNLLNSLTRDIEEIKRDVFALLLYGSYATGDVHSRSDIDVCAVVKSHDKEKIKELFRRILQISAKNEKYDIRIFEQMPLYMKMQVIEQGKMLYAKDKGELGLYFYFYRKLWEDQAVHRISAYSS